MVYKFIGVDIGGSHITAALVDIQQGVIAENTLVRAKVNPHQSAENILKDWAATIQAVADIAQLSNYHLGIAMPGPFEYSTGICLMKNVNKYEQLYQINIKNELAERLKIQAENIRFRNDAEAFLEGEMLFGAGKYAQKGIGITLGTGLGTSKFDNGITSDMALGINHLIHDGVAEDYISTRWFVEYYQFISKKTVQGVKQLAEMYEEDPFAREVFQAFSQNLSLFVRDIVGIFQPEIIIFGGNIAQASSLFFGTVEKTLSHYQPPIQIKKSTLNEKAALMGAVGFGISMNETSIQ